MGATPLGGTGILILLLLVASASFLALSSVVR